MRERLQSWRQPVSWPRMPLVGVSKAQNARGPLGCHLWALLAAAQSHAAFTTVVLNRHRHDTAIHTTCHLESQDTKIWCRTSLAISSPDWKRAFAWCDNAEEVDRLF